jgi:hypothetical protein
MKVKLYLVGRYSLKFVQVPLGQNSDILYEFAFCGIYFQVSILELSSCLSSESRKGGLAHHRLQFVIDRLQLRKIF